MISACVEGLRFLNHGSSRPPCSPKGGLLAGVSRDVWRKAPPNPRCCRILVSVVRPEVRCWTHRWAEVGHRTWSALPVLWAEVRCSQAAFYFCWNNKLPGNTLSLLFTRNTGMLQTIAPTEPESQGSLLASGLEGLHRQQGWRLSCGR